MSYKPPQSFFLLPDSLLAGKGKGIVLDHTEADGLSPGSAPADETNEGSMAVVQTGVPTQALDIDYGIIASGDIRNEATWAWKKSTDNPTLLTPGWRGENDQRYNWAPHDPFGGVHNDDSYDVAYCPLNGREFVYSADQLDIHYAYRDVRTNEHRYTERTPFPASWTIGVCKDASNGQDIVGVGGTNGRLGVCTMNDGTMIMVCNNSSSRDFRIYHSVNGTDWKLRSDNILARFGLYGMNTTTPLVLRLEKSGEYICICWGWYDADDSQGLGTVYLTRTIVSGDRGATFKEVSTFSAALRAVRDSHNLGLYYDICGIDDQAGTFLMVYRVNGTRNQVNVLYREGFQSWAENTTVRVTGAVPPTWGSVAIQRGPQYIQFFNFYESASGDMSVHQYMIDPRNWSSLSGWKQSEELWKGDGVIYNWPISPRLCNVDGKYLSWYSAIMYDGEIDSGTRSPLGNIYMRWGGWAQFPVQEMDHSELLDAPAYQQQPGLLRSAGGSNLYNLTIVAWDAWMGTPEPGGTYSAASTPWTNPASGNVTLTYTLSQYRIADNNVAGVSQHEIEYVDAALTYSWGGAQDYQSPSDRSSTCLEVIVRVFDAPAVHLLAPYVGVQYEGYDVNNAFSGALRYDLHVSTTEIGVADNVLGTWIINPVAVSGLGGMNTIRVSMLSQPWNSGDPVEIALWRVDHESDDQVWELLGTGTVSTYTGGGGTQQVLRWGHLYGYNNADRISEWQRVRLMGPHDGGGSHVIPDAWENSTASSSDDIGQRNLLRGRLATHDEIGIHAGISAIMGGSGGLELDDFHGTIREVYGPENMLALGSPRSQYRTKRPASGTTQMQIVYDAYESSSGARFVHSGFAAMGYNLEQITVEYSDVANFSSVNALHTLNNNLYTGRVSQAHGSGFGVEIQGEGAGRGIRPGGLNGGYAKQRQYYLRVTGLPAGCTLVDRQSYLITEDTEAEGKHFLRLRTSTDFSDYANVAGVSFSIYSGGGVEIYDETAIGRYMRVTSMNTLTPHGGQVRLGSIVAGVSFTMGDIIEWTHSEGESPSTTDFESSGVQRWGYLRGPARRVWEGRIAGDTSTMRQRLRNYLRVTSQYDVYPVVLVKEDGRNSDPDRVLFGTFTGGIQMDHQGYKYNDITGRWDEVGDLVITMTEEV